MYKFEKKIQEAEKRGIHFSEGQMTYIRCARINGIDLLDHLYEKYTREYVSCPHGENTDEYLTTISTILLASEFFDENLCELVSQMIEQNKLYSAKGGLGGRKTDKGREDVCYSEET